MALLRLERLEPGRYSNRLHDSNRNGRAFGGQLMGQVMRAAEDFAADKQPAMLRLLFLRGVDVEQAVDYQVTPLQAGKRFASCHVRGQQGTAWVVDAQVTFQSPPQRQEHGHAVAPPSGL